MKKRAFAVLAIVILVSSLVFMAIPAGAAQIQSGVLAGAMCDVRFYYTDPATGSYTHWDSGMLAAEGFANVLDVGSLLRGCVPAFEASTGLQFSKVVSDYRFYLQLSSVVDLPVYSLGDYGRSPSMYLRNTSVGSSVLGDPTEDGIYTAWTAGASFDVIEFRTMPASTFLDKLIIGSTDSYEAYLLGIDAGYDSGYDTGREDGLHAAYGGIYAGATWTVSVEYASSDGGTGVYTFDEFEPIYGAAAVDVMSVINSRKSEVPGDIVEYNVHVAFRVPFDPGVNPVVTNNISTLYTFPQLTLFEDTKAYSMTIVDDSTLDVYGFFEDSTDTVTAMDFTFTGDPPALWFWVQNTGYNLGWSDGYSAGTEAGQESGYREGYTRGESDGYTKGYIEGDDVGFHQGMLAGFEAGSQDGYLRGDADGYARGESNGYRKGYEDGLSIADQSDFYGLISAVIDAPISAFTGLLSFEILGVNFANFVLSLISAYFAIKILRMVF